MLLVKTQPHFFPLNVVLCPHPNKVCAVSPPSSVCFFCAGCVKPPQLPFQGWSPTIQNLQEGSVLKTLNLAHKLNSQN